jgi:hypothetical protein
MSEKDNPSVEEIVKNPTLDPIIEDIDGMFMYNTMGQLDELINRSKVVVLFSGTTCTPCLYIEKVIEESEDMRSLVESEGLKIIKVNSGFPKFFGIYQQYGPKEVRPSVPQIVAWDHGQRIGEVMSKVNAEEAVRQISLFYTT